MPRRTLMSLLRNRQGSIPIMTALLLPVMVLTAGGAVDLVVHERGRIALQDALDRGVLAAASLNQTQDATAVVRSFLKNVPSGDTAILDVKEVKTLNKREITASASIAYATTFLKLADVDTLTINASSTAEESRKNIELSLVLDISGSMLDNGGMTQLRPAAKTFLELVLKEDTKATTSVNVVPFAGQVNLGRDVFEYITSAAYNSRVDPYGKAKHQMSWCLDMTATDFSSGTPVFYDRRQTPHFTYYNYGLTAKLPWWCPTGPTITYMSNDLAALKTKMDALQPYDGTGTAYGMKWAELLLNPSMRATLQAIRTKGYAPISSTFSARPAAFTDKETLKFIVLMTDGQIGFQPRPTDDNKPESRYSVIAHGLNAKSSYNTTINSYNNGKDEVGKGFDAFTEAESKGFYKTVCSYAKAEGIKIFTIAFKVSDAIAATIAECASEKTFAYKVDGLDMASAFQSIAAQMQQLRLMK